MGIHSFICNCQSNVVNTENASYWSIPYHNFYFILQNIRVYGVYWGCRSLKDLYEKISVSTGGKCFPSYKFEFDLFDTLMEMCYLNHDNAMLQVKISLMLLLNNRDIRYMSWFYLAVYGIKIFDFVKNYFIQWTLYVW